MSGFGGLKIYEGQIKNSNFVEKQKANTLLENQIQEADNPQILPTKSGNIQLKNISFWYKKR